MTACRMIELSVILFAFVVGALVLICAPHDDDDEGGE